MKTFKIGFSGIALLLVSLACVVTIPVPGGNAPTIFPTDTPTPLNSATPTLTPSRTPLPTPTHRAVVTEAVFAFPTITPLPPIPTMTLSNFAETLISGSVSPTNTRDPAKIKTSTPKPLKCRVEAVKPFIGQNFKAGTDFEAGWRIYNEGGKAWIENEFYFDFVGGDRMHNPGFGPKYVSYVVFYGDRIRFDVRMRAPKTPGRYSATWGLWQAGKKEPFCTFSVTIDVVK